MHPQRIVANNCYWDLWEKYMGTVMWDGIHLPVRDMYRLCPKFKRGLNELQAPKNARLGQPSCTLNWLLLLPQHCHIDTQSCSSTYSLKQSMSISLVAVTALTLTLNDGPPVAVVASNHGNCSYSKVSLHTTPQPQELEASETPLPHYWGIIELPQWMYSVCWASIK